MDPSIAVTQLTAGGGVANGNTIINSDTTSTTYAGAEGTFIGDKAGGAFVGAANANTAVGHNSCGVADGATTASGSNNSCYGDDAGRNITGAATSNTLVGQAAAEDISGNNNTVIGEAAAVHMTSGVANVIIGQGAGGNAILTAVGDIIIGQGAGTHMVSGNQNVVIGNAVASTTLATGAGNVIIGTNSTCDAAAAGTNNSIRVCMGGGLAWSLSNGSTPATSTTLIAGQHQASSYTSTGTKFTTSGCSISATTGGGTAGTFTLGANSCTAVVTMNGATGATAPTGWSCQAHDRTAPTVLIGGESSSTATTASFTIPAGAGATDVISFSCVGF